MRTLELIIPGIVAIIGNFVFYLIIKNRIDKSIERYKIAYAGVFKEKIDIYKEILRQIFDLKNLINNFNHFGKQEDGKEVMKAFNELIRYYKINQPYISDSIVGNIKEMIKELEGCFDDYFTYKS